MLLQFNMFSVCIFFSQNYTHVSQEHDDNILPNREVEVTLAASSSGQSVLGNRTGVEYAEANPPEVKGAQKKRKLSSE